MHRLVEFSLAQNEKSKNLVLNSNLFAPTLVCTVYGMNFNYMPELDWAFGYPFALALMLAMGIVLYLSFKHRKWL